MDEDTVGHFGGFVTHKLRADKPDLLKVGSCELKPELPVMYSSTEKKEGWVVPININGTPVMTLQHEGNSSAYNPYWIVKVNKNIIPNHNEVLQGNFVCFIKEFLPKDY